MFSRFAKVIAQLVVPELLRLVEAELAKFEAELAARAAAPAADA